MLRCLCLSLRLHPDLWQLLRLRRLVRTVLMKASCSLPGVYMMVAEI